MDFKIKDAEQIRTRLCSIASETVIEAGDLVTLTAGLIVKAVAGSTAVAYAPNGSKAGETEIVVTTGNEFTLTGTADANFAVTQKGTEVDIVGTTTQLIDLGASNTGVLKVGIAEDSGAVGATTSIEVRINKPLF